MQAPPVQYVMTFDGVRIAYTISGQGPPVLMATEPVVSHTQLEWSHPLFGRIMARLAERNTLIRFDMRGTGLSQRGVPVRFEGGLRDLEAVIRQIGLTHFAAIGVQSATISLVTYASHHPGTITRLVLLDGFSNIDDMAQTTVAQALSAAAQADFWLATEAIGAAALGAGKEEVRDYGAYIRACVDQDYFRRLPGVTDEERAAGDATGLLSSIDVPTLAMRHTGLPYVTAEMTRALAAGIRNARYQEVAGGWADDPVGLVDIVNAFLHEGEAAAPEQDAAVGTSGGLRAILFTDIEGHTSMMQRLGDSAGRDVLRAHEQITRETLRTHGGAEVKAMGDGFMASFASVASAAECAVALQQAFAARNAPEPIAVRIGLNAGEPIAEDDDLFGSSVILAARVAAQAKGGEILVSDTVRGLLSGKRFLFSDRGETALRGFEDPVRLYELRWAGGP